MRDRKTETAKTVDAWELTGNLGSISRGFECFDLRLSRSCHRFNADQGFEVGRYGAMALR